MMWVARRIAPFSTRSLSTPASSSSIYISMSTSPYFNLSVEDWLFREAPSERPLLFLYRNEPCVIIGRNQNPWKEINFSALRTLNVPWVRRRSGGGTVYHDLGNTNFSIHLPRKSFNRHHTARVVQRALHSMDINAVINERNDICVGGSKMSTTPLPRTTYVSGSAYKIVHDRAYHHGTMLITTTLTDLGNVLRNTRSGMVTKGVESVRSPVHNLRQFDSGVSHSTFVSAVVAEFKREYETDSRVQQIHEDDETRNIGHIRDGIVELQKWEWKYGQTPEFTHRFSHKFDWGEVIADICSKHGVILSCSLSSSSPAEQMWCEELARSLVGVKYASLEGLNIQGTTVGFNNERRRRGVIDWLREDM